YLHEIFTGFLKDDSTGKHDHVLFVENDNGDIGGHAGLDPIVFAVKLQFDPIRRNSVPDCLSRIDGGDFGTEENIFTVSIQGDFGRGTLFNKRDVYFRHIAFYLKRRGLLAEAISPTLASIFVITPSKDARM
ncbi:MAG: hypothetical protein UV43_C0039G0001, partial [Parcubacteria group bacterium GW2011_GWF2_42_7]